MKFDAWIKLAIVLMACGAPARLVAQEATTAAADGAAKAPVEKESKDDTLADVLSSDEWQQVDAAVDRALNWLAAQQQPDGSFPTQVSGQPGVTSLCTLAFMAHGHLPGDGIYGRPIERAADYVIQCQKENGLITLVGPDGSRLSRNVGREVGKCGAYNHAISSLILSELYGTSELQRAERIESAINKSLAVTLEMQRWPKDRQQDKGGWRYLDDFNASDSDLSVTGWELQFLRSARNAGFNVPKQPIDDAVLYVRRCYSEEYGAFKYTTVTADRRTRGMAGAGILALANAGFHKAPEALLTGDWILAHDFKRYNDSRWVYDRYHYGLYTCCQGMYQLGGRHWEAFFPPVVETLLTNQQPDGSWPAENHLYDARFGDAYTTALVLLTLGAPNQLLPIYQR